MDICPTYESSAGYQWLHLVEAIVVPCSSRKPQPVAAKQLCIATWRSKFPVTLELSSSKANSSIFTLVISHLAVSLILGFFWRYPFCCCFPPIFSLKEPPRWKWDLKKGFWCVGIKMDAVFSRINLVGIMNFGNLQVAVVFTKCHTWSQNT